MSFEFFKSLLIRSRRKIEHLDGHLVTPDIIVHHRLCPTENLLAIEAKSEDDQRGKRGIDEDREKLASYLGNPSFYRYVALLIFSATDQPSCSYELFQQGENPRTPKPERFIKGVGR